MKNLTLAILLAALTACNSSPTGANLTATPVLEKPAPEAPKEPVVEPTPEPSPEPTVSPSPEPSASMTAQEAFTNTGDGSSAAFIALSPKTTGTGLGAIQGIEIVSYDSSWNGVYLIYPSGAEHRYLSTSSPDYTLQHAIDNIGSAIVLVDFHWVDSDTAGVDVCTRSITGVVANCVLVTQDVE